MPCHVQSWYVAVPQSGSGFRKYSEGVVAAARVGGGTAGSVSWETSSGSAATATQDPAHTSFRELVALDRCGGRCQECGRCRLVR